MSALEETVVKEAAEASRTKTKPKSQPIGNRFLDFLSSVRFGVVLLCIMVFLAFLGMIIIQQNVQGFETYFASLTPAEKWLFGNLGLFDIYHSWYFNFLLLVLSLNIVLASIDRFPSAWKYISAPKRDASRAWLLNQKFNAKISMHGESPPPVAEKIVGVFRRSGLKPRVTEKNNRVYVFGESGKWNRLGAYIVHVALLTLFLGHFVALQSGFDADVRLMPGQKTSEIQLIDFDLDNTQGLQTQRYNVALPFSITCTDIEQKLIDPKKDIGIQNTLDWRTQIKIDDPEYGETVADVQLNKPFSYRGFRFFQASAITVGSARKMTLELVPENGGQPLNINLMRNGSATLPDGTKIDYEAFFPDFTLANGQADTRSPDYNNPAVKLNITTPAGEKKNAYAFFNKLPDGIPVGAPVAGYKFRLADFEKVPLAHVLSIKYDPYHGAFIAWYFGGFGLIGALIFVFFLSHKRVWALIQKKDLGESCEVVLGGNTNRNHQGFEDKFKRIVEKLETQT
ncbi:MAG TPA: cytochrome c biogenesis protein ResB [Pyrinomonadaceae bacterium]|jgi:cytochrome c biogenesis protein